MTLSKLNSQNPRLEEMNIQLAAKHLAQPELIAAKVREQR